MTSVLLESGRLSRRLGGGLLFILLTATGIYECRIVYNVDRGALVFDENAPITSWICENVDSGDIILTDRYALNEVVMGGAMLYYGWPYYAWSAGYDTAAREQIVRELFAESDPERLKKRVAQEGIRYILIDDGLRLGGEYELREDVIAAAFPLVWQDFDISIYDVGESRE